MVFCREASTGAKSYDLDQYVNSLESILNQKISSMQGRHGYRLLLSTLNFVDANSAGSSSFAFYAELAK